MLGMRSHENLNPVGNPKGRTMTYTGYFSVSLFVVVKEDSEMYETMTLKPTRIDLVPNNQKIGNFVNS